MTKTEKLKDKAIRHALTLACEQAKDKVAGFSWLTHQANLKQLPQSLTVQCYFTDAHSLAQARDKQTLACVVELVVTELANIGYHVKPDAVSFTSE
ncbi:hypothetical protein [Pseudoalteromonas mariniglutinosa]|uniref:hypothetical protein n=1 Tax=Pseudoalteromonas mariniglutinosa TaxID=206042 RepID=UPI00384F518C